MPSSIARLALAAAASACLMAGSAKAMDAPLETMVTTQLQVQTDDMPVEKACLSEAIFYEAGSEPMAGRLAVANVIMNRTRSGMFPSSVCGVVRQRGQFTYRRGSRSMSGRAWAEARAVADLALEGVGNAGIGARAMYFHAVRARVSTAGMRLVGRIGGHLFYERRD